MGTFTPHENSSFCMDCDLPPCASNLTYCHPVSGQERTYTLWHPIVAPTIVCNATDPFDVCDAPEYCMANTLACNPEPNRSSLQFARTCPHLLSTTSAFADDPMRCWEQAVANGTVNTPYSRSDLDELTAVVPLTMRASAHCGGRHVPNPQYQFFFVVCPVSGVNGTAATSVVCSDSTIQCPSIVDLESEWWTSFGAITVHVRAAPQQEPLPLRAPWSCAALADHEACAALADATHENARRRRRRTLPGW